MGCGLAPYSREALWKCWALPDLFTDAWDAAFELIMTDLHLLSEQSARALMFIDHLTEHWQQNADVVLVKNEYMKINLLIESFHKLLTKKLTHKNDDIYKFIRKYQQYSEYQST